MIIFRWRPPTHHSMHVHANAEAWGLYLTLVLAQIMSGIVLLVISREYIRALMDLSQVVIGLYSFPVSRGVVTPDPPGPFRPGKLDPLFLISGF